MKHFAILFVSGLLVSSTMFGQEAKPEAKKEGYHCEKKGEDGKPTDVPAASKDECKKAGGKWSKDHAGGHDHGHGKDDGHKP